MHLHIDTLPEALILEICDYLDLFSLVTLSEVNRAFNALSKASKAWWLHALTQSQLYIPLPTHRPLRSYTATELYLAAHRVVRTERNITSSRPRLYSWRYITWPYEPSPGVHLVSEAAKDETAEDAIHMHLAHPNGNWMFTVSNQNVLRILHLRSGKLALAYDGEMFGNDRDVASLVAWAVEFREEDKASLVMNCQSFDKNRQIWRPAIRLFHIHFDDKQCLATMQGAGYRFMNSMASHLDIAGGYIVAIQNSKWPYDAGDVLLIRWATMESIPLPVLLPSVRIASFQEYFISVGIAIKGPFGSSEDRIHLQIVGYPPCEDDMVMVASDNSLSKSAAKDASLSVHSYAIPFKGLLIHGGVPFSSYICHFYTGEAKNSIKLWIRTGRSGAWTIFPIQLDLASLRSSTVRFRTQRAYEGEALHKEFVVTEQERQHVLEERYLVHWASPLASGRRFIWWRSVDHLPRMDHANEDTSSTDEDSKREEPFRLFLSVIDDLAKMDEWDAEVDFMIDPTQEDHVFHAVGRQLKAARQLEIPPGLAGTTGLIYMFVMEEWSGLVVIQMYSGDLWVLRYGKA